MEDIREEEIQKHEEAEISKRKDNRKVENCLEESLLYFKKLNAISVSSEVDDCTKMIDEIQDLLKKIESLKNLKPPSDIDYVKNDILLHKSRIRNLIKDIDSSLAFGKLPFDSKGEIDFINAFCYKCLSKNTTDDSIFILCDGGCKRGFHQSCLDPYLSLEPSTPYSNALGWICYECHWKALCFNLLQNYHKTRLLTADSWEKVFPEAEEYRPPSSDSKERRKGAEMEDISEEEIQKLEEAEISTRKDNRKVENCPKESDDCTKMIDEIQDLLKKIESLKNLKPPSDIEYVKNDILLYKSRIRNLIKDIDSSLAFGKLPFDSKGEIDFINVFCYKCLSKKITRDIIFILCKGGCKRGFHQSCLEPSLNSDVINWVCYECNCKARCFELLQKYHKTAFSTGDTWEKVFPEAEEYRPPSSDSKGDYDYISDEKKELISNELSDFWASSSYTFDLVSQDVHISTSKILTERA